ncbi:MAG: acyl-ACP--UDP-N-acetylglucosamine O-acyltransferase [Kiritimatiellae bacterium]|nr:acyl-ACP--UDP-N-acetylglucosamine O-acyltransferase [Kiritimatiellia bacterium]MDY0149356.1 acyl-ACP--UDP-N-acetylglucosamine O-acyltransferase [Kiritimatiellia bacterium]
MIHPTAIVEPGADIGADVHIGPHAYVAATSRLGDRCVLAPHAVVLDNTTLGARCTVHAGAVIGDLPQDLSFGGGPSFVVIGDDCTFREGVTIHRGTQSDTTTRIGDHVYMMANSHAAHNCEVGDHVIMANGAALGGYVTVGERAFIGGNTGIHQFCHIGRLAMVASCCFISKDLPPFCCTVSSANSRIAGLNVVGLRRAGFTPAQRKQIKQVFTTLYRSGLNTSQACEKFRADSDNPFAAEIVDFIDRATRGLCRPSVDRASPPDA